MADQSGTGEERKKKRIELSVPQVAGSAVAAVMAAKLASSFGVYGTILGAGVISVVATCGGPVLQHFFSRTGEQVREAAERAKPGARQVPVTEDGRPVPETFRSGGTTEAAGAAAGELQATTLLPAVDGTRAWRTDGAVDATTALPTVRPADTERTQLLGTVRESGPAQPAEAEETTLLRTVDGQRPDDATQLLRRADETMLLRPRQRGTAGDSAASADAESATPFAPSEGFRDSGVQGKRVRSWKRPLLGAAVVFGVTMAGITTYELVSGESFSGGDRPTIGQLGGGGSSHSDPDPTPTPSSSTEPSDEESGGTSDEQPEPGATTPDTGTAPTQGDQWQDGESDGSSEAPRPSVTPTPTPTTPTPTPTDRGTEDDDGTGNTDGNGRGDLQERGVQGPDAE